MSTKTKINNIIQVFVKVPNKTITIDIEKGHDMSIAELKKRIMYKEGITESMSFLTYSSKVLDSNKCLSFYNIERESTIQLIIKKNSLEPPKLKRQLESSKYNIAYKIAKINNLPCTAQIDSNTELYYIVIPDGTTIVGSVFTICNDLKTYSYSWSDIISLDEARNIQFGI